MRILHLCHAEETGLGYLAYCSQELFNLCVSREIIILNMTMAGINLKDSYLVCPGRDLGFNPFVFFFSFPGLLCSQC